LNTVKKSNKAFYIRIKSCFIQKAGLKAEIPITWILIISKESTPEGCGIDLSLEGADTLCLK